MRRPRNECVGPNRVRQPAPYLQSRADGSSQEVPIRAAYRAGMASLAAVRRVDNHPDRLGQRAAEEPDDQEREDDRAPDDDRRLEDPWAALGARPPAHVP